MHQQAEAGEAAAALEPAAEVVGQAQPLRCHAQHRLAGVEQQVLAVVDPDALGGGAEVDVVGDLDVAGHADEDAEGVGEVQVHRRWPHAGGVVGVDDNLARLDRLEDLAVAQDRHGSLAPVWLCCADSTRLTAAPPTQGPYTGPSAGPCRGRANPEILELTAKRGDV